MLRILMGPLKPLKPLKTVRGEIQLFPPGARRLSSSQIRDSGQQGYSDLKDSTREDFREYERGSVRRMCSYLGKDPL